MRAEVGDLPVGRGSLRTVRSNYLLARRISRFLVRAALSVEITRHGRAVLEIGAGVRSSPLARILGIENVRLVRGNRPSGTI
jgi:antitoxin (DNA-binding transcriptional repressor) of toxin-antitoxin stability system